MNSYSAEDRYYLTEPQSADDDVRQEIADAEGIEVEDVTDQQVEDFLRDPDDIHDMDR